MAQVATFGVDATMISAEYWAQFTFSANSTPTTAKIDEIIIKVAAEVSGALTSSGATASSANPASTPISYSWLQDTTGYGAAARLGRTMTGADPELAQEYQRIFEKRIAELRKDPASVIPDLYSGISGASGEVRTHVRSLGYADDGTDATTYEPTLRVEDDL